MKHCFELTLAKMVPVMWFCTDLTVLIVYHGVHNLFREIGKKEQYHFELMAVVE